VGGGFQVSGLYFFGSGERQETLYGGDLRDTASGTYSGRLRPDGTIVPRNDYTQPVRRRVDLRIQQRIPLGRLAIDGIAEMFNVFNSPNWTINTDESSRQYLQRIAGQNRTAQLGFRLTF
jgi:hypothetical protein